MSHIAEAKQTLPLPSLMRELGLGDHAKRSARCPLHEDRRNSFSVWQKDGVWFWKCHAGCGEGDEINFLEKRRTVSRGDAIKLYLEMAGVNGATPNKAKLSVAFDWHSCVEAFTDKHVERLAEWRGYSREFCSWLKQNGLVGLYDGGIAFPVHDRTGNVIAAHYRQKDGSWRYAPQGVKVRPLVIGKLIAGDRVNVFESYWDAFSFMDVSGEHNGVIITRGASNGASLADLVARSSTIYAWTQNDAAGEKWQRDICANTPALVKRARIPEPHKDLNDWTRAGATSDELLEAMVSADNSLNSQFLPFAKCDDDYPQALGLEAFHGLAGEIVRRIEPHTEADPAALLFQFLAAFGNLIGHDHYIVADGTRHYLILYGVLVGQTSKGRKGTSWNHIANLMERIDPEWRQDRVSYGLSSGEGLIWEVRDPIEETRPIREKGRHTGEYETFIANHGEDDKRLLVIEAEFANVLKVMAREGNTLSPVIRCAWDSGDLRTMVKNSPAKATKAHISIVGHITRDELRRLLTQTESANGFANRFFWLAVKRSKCLPDGGAIDTVNFDDVVTQLQSAVDFAKDFLEITRDPEAKKLWREDYPNLSEGKPGMLGAITGRAEAQVMRISTIYALLDKSYVIRPEHHRAAMALWSYCEESCRWIFGTSTGDRNADKIFVALRHAPNGMTKTEISVEVFNRHASSAEIDEALRLLHGLKMAYYRVEITGGAPLQRWFVVGETSEKSE
jgi:Protein of unknown function (DUF3987)/CHC2 zinc finger/Toprim-like